MKAKVIAFYLPQFHPVPENDKFWGKGFTEWTNTAKAKPLFKGHYQPNVPSDLGFYDLRLAESRKLQAELAKSFGIHAFAYWHYWFGNGKQILEQPFNDVVKSGEPDFPFCAAWANETWTGVWHGANDSIIAKQEYPGIADYEAHFYHLLPAFLDRRYLKYNDKPIFIVLKPNQIPDPKQFIDIFNNLAIKNGLKGVYIIGYSDRDTSCLNYGFDASILSLWQNIYNVVYRSFSFKIRNKFPFINKLSSKKPTIINYSSAIDEMKYGQLDTNVFPVIFPNWDNTPRSAWRGTVLQNSTPELFKKHLLNALEAVSSFDNEKRFVFVKSWNEWAEGNYLEPDLRWGSDYLSIIKNCVL